MIALSSNDDKRMQSIDLIKIYAYGLSEYLGSEKEVINFDNVVKEIDLEKRGYYLT